MDLSKAAGVRADRLQIATEVRSELGVPGGHLLALTVANLRAEKGYDVLLEAARLAKEAGLPLRFAAVGRGALEGPLTRRCHEIGIDDSFRFLGARSDVLRLLAGADLFVLPSRQEGLPVALMEAAAMGVALVVTAVGEIPRLLSDETDALIVPPDCPTSLASALSRIAADSDLRTRLGRASLAKGSLFEVGRATRTLESIYLDLAGTRS